MTSPTSARSNHLNDANRTDLALPLAAVISLAITSYVVVVLVGKYRFFALLWRAEISR